MIRKLWRLEQYCGGDPRSFYSPTSQGRFILCLDATRRHLKANES
jgi:hypothetical protein